MSRKALVPIELPGNPTQPLEATPKQYVDGLVGTVGGNPLGTIIDYWGITAPVGHLECDGSTFDGLTYPDLEAHLGGTTLPDLRDRSTIGRSATRPLGTAAGSEAASMPAHTHTANFVGTAMTNHGHADTLAAPSHTHTIAHTHAQDVDTVQAGTGGSSANYTIGSGSIYTFSSGTGLVTGGVSTANSGGPSSTTLGGSVTVASAGTPAGTVTVNQAAAVGDNYHPVMAVLKCIKATL